MPLSVWSASRENIPSALGISRQQSHVVSADPGGGYYELCQAP